MTQNNRSASRMHHLFIEPVVFFQMCHRLGSLVVVSILVSILAASTLFPAPAQAQGHIRGRVTEAETGAPLIGANVSVVGTTLGAAADAAGRFEIRNVPAGPHTLEASILGFETQREDVVVDADTLLTVSFVLEAAAISLREVVVTPGRFTVMQAQPTVAQTLSREDIQSLPQLGEDIYRVVARLPGLSSNDYSAAFTMRGGTNDEVLVQLDGLELYEPFHLKDIGGGALSILDVESIGGIDMMTGAFPAEYGDRLSGVFNITSHTPTPGRTRTSAGLSFTAARFLTEGRFAGGNGEWLVLARRGYLDIILGLIGDDSGFSPTYYDVFGKSRYRFNERHTLGVNVLQAGDDIGVDDDEDGFRVANRYGSSYAWLTWSAIWSRRLHAQTVLSAGRLTWDRTGLDVFNEFNLVDFRVDDERHVNYVGLKQDWTYDLAKNHLLKAGFDVRRFDAAYDYTNLFSTSSRIVDDELVVTYDSTFARLDPDGTRLGLYLGHRMRLWRPLTVEWGLRYDAVAWTDDALLSPRVNAALALGARSVLRLGWGHYYQSQGIHQVNVQDGEDRFFPAERAEHRVVGVEHAFGPATHLRVEAYQKKLTDLRPRYINLVPDNTDFFPEVYQDRARFEPTSGDARGLELLVRHQAGEAFDVSGSYGYAVAEDKIEGVTIPRVFDQRHTIYLDLGYRPSAKWRLHLSWVYRTGWPYTEQFFEKVDHPDGTFHIAGSFGPVNGERFPAYHRMDLRVSRYFDFRRSRLAAFIEISNLYDRANPRLYFYTFRLTDAGQLRVLRNQEDWLPRVPSIGVSWDLYR